MYCPDFGYFVHYDNEFGQYIGLVSPPDKIVVNENPISKRAAWSMLTNGGKKKEF
jgi:hypothetical protein